MKLFAPGTSCETEGEGEGEIDIVEVYIDTRGLGDPAKEWPNFPPLGVADEAMRAAVVATFVAAQAGNGPRARLAATVLGPAACRFLQSQVLPRRATASTKGVCGPSPAAALSA